MGDGNPILESMTNPNIVTPQIAEKIGEDFVWNAIVDCVDVWELRRTMSTPEWQDSGLLSPMSCVC